MGNFDDPENVTGLVELFQYVDSTTAVQGLGNMLGIVILLIIGAISFLISKSTFTMDRAALSSMFLVLIVGVFLFVLDLLNVTILTIVIVLFIITLFLNANAGDRTA